MSRDFLAPIINLSLLTTLFHICALRGDTLDAFSIHDDTTYIVEYSFTTTCSESLLLDICYGFGHLLNFAARKHTTISELTSGEDWYTVVYEYRYLFYRSRSTYTKRIEPDRGRVSFEMIDFEQNIRVLPVVVRSSGFYEISCGDERVVKYYQTTVLDGELTGFCLHYVINRTERFLRDFETYVKKHEPDRGE
jgi:hypothetical protein